MRRVITGYLLAALVIASGVVISAQPALAATFTVTTAGDGADAVPGNGICAAATGECTLRAAIQEANTLAGPDRIDVLAMTIPLGSRLEITSPIELVGDGAERTILDGDRKDLVFLVKSGPITFRGLTVRGGSGGGIFVSGGTVEINDARITDNHAFGGGGGVRVASGATVRVRRTTIDGNQGAGAAGGGAGGISNSGTLFVHESLIGGNPAGSTQEVGPGTGNGSNRTGGIWNGPRAILNLRNTTLSGNVGDSPDAGTGGILNAGFAFLNNVTITNNKGRGNNLGSFRGGGLLSTSGATTVVKNSIIANNDGRGGPHDCAGALSSDSRYNLIENTAGCQLPAATDTFVLGVSAQLGPLEGNGWPTRTHLPAPTSPAIDAGFPFPPGGPAADSCEPIDQRLFPRLLICDMGAVELQLPVPTELAATTTADQVDASPGNGICATASGSCTLRAAVQEANRLPGRQTITVPAGTYDLSIPPSDEGGLDPAAGGDLDLLDNVDVAGADRATVIIDGNDLSRIFDVAPGVTARISGVTIRDGTDLGGGGLRALSASLTLGRVIVEDNESSLAGGGIEVGGIDSALVVRNSIVRKNHAPFFGGDGGGIDASGVITVDRSQIVGNQASGAGGGLRATGAVTVIQSTVAGNRASGSVFANGGGISASGLNLVESTVSGNTADLQGGGVFVSGSGSSMVNSTISGNTSGTNGGGLSTSGSISLVHVTIAANQATGGGNGLHRFGLGSEISLQNTILANPSGTECAGLSPSSKGNNIARDASCGLTASGDRQNTNARLGPLADNRGPTQTHLPQVTSPAIDAAAEVGVPNDQRGVPRPQGPAPDIGSVERT